MNNANRSAHLVIIALALLCAIPNYQLFIFPNRFAPAGLNGICTMIQYVFHINVGYMSLLINIPLALLVADKGRQGIRRRAALCSSSRFRWR